MLLNLSFMFNLLRIIRQLRLDRRGNVAAAFLLSLPIMIGMTGLTVEYGNALVVRTVNQRTADAAAFAAAIAYNTTASTTQMQSAASRIATLNGLSTASVVASVVTSPSNSARNAVQVQITQTVPLLLTKFFNGQSTLPVVVSSAAEISTTTTASTCIVALDGTSTGIQVSGGANIQAKTCGVNSNAQIATANCGAYIQSGSVTYNTSLSIQNNCGGSAYSLRTASGGQQNAVKQATADPYASSTVVSAARSRLTTVAALTAPASPTVTVPGGGPTINLSSQGSGTTTLSNNCKLIWANSTWDLECPVGTSSNVTISPSTVCGGCKVTFNANANAATTLNITGSLTGQDLITFGYGTFNISGGLTAAYGGMVVHATSFNVAGQLTTGTSGNVTFDGTNLSLTVGKGLYLQGSATTAFSAGTFNIGKMTLSNNCTTFYSICASSSGGTTFAGPSTFVLNGGIRTTGGASLTLGAGTSNSYNIGVSSDGYAMRADGGAKIYLADVTSGTGIYQFLGNINTSGGTCLFIGAAAQHDIKGSFWSAGAAKLGAGIYTVTGSVNFGGSGGGDVTCNGQTIGLYADGVTFVIGAASGTLATSGDCNGQAFCLSSGYGHVTLNAPAAGATSTAGFAVIGPSSASNTAGATFTSGASNTVITGVFYLPNGAINLSGGAGLGSATGCLELYGKSISVSAGALLGTACVAAGGGVGATTYQVRLVQ